MLEVQKEYKGGIFVVKQYSYTQLHDISYRLYEELIKADNGEKTDFAYSIHELSKKKDLSDSSQVMVIGGSNFQSCRVINNKLDLEHVVSEELSSITSKKILMDVVLRNILPDVKSLAVNFAFPLTPTVRNGILDGKLIRGTKNHTLNGCEGFEIGFLIEEECKLKDRDLSVTVANDTICLILAGLRGSEEKYLAGGVVGTGFNFGFFRDDGSVVNIESGNFKNFISSDTGIIIDKESSNPNEQLYEKEVAGAYLYKHYNLLKGRDICANSKELSRLATDGDKTAQELFQRSASLVASEIAALYKLKNHEKLNCVIEGSLFWKGWNYKEMVTQYCSELAVAPESLKIFFVENSSLQGAMHLL
jgi:hexokinase